MADPPSLWENSAKYYKPKDDSPKEKGFSFFAFIISLVIYIFVFYIFNLSLTTLLNKYIFWFFLSNNLILIIALDYRVSSSSKKKQHPYYDQYHASSYYQAHKKYINPKQEIGEEMPQVVNPHIINENMEVSQRPRGLPQSLTSLGTKVPQYLVKNGREKPSEEFSNVQKALLPLEVENSDHRASEEQPVPAAISHCRSKSKRAPRNDKIMKRMKRSATLTKIEEKVDEENDFNSMTIEELNWRFEEFIKKFNRQVRLEANRDVLQIAD